MLIPRRPTLAALTERRQFVLDRMGYAVVSAHFAERSDSTAAFFGLLVVGLAVVDAFAGGGEGGEEEEEEKDGGEEVGSDELHCWKGWRVSCVEFSK
jgi:hypothetical protein